MVPVIVYLYFESITRIVKEYHFWKFIDVGYPYVADFLFRALFLPIVSICVLYLTLKTKK
jgi:hypothetical protein